jgi:hypothetical protein
MDGIRPSHINAPKEQLVDGDADANTCANMCGLPNRSTKPKRPIGTQVNSVQPLVDLQCGR